MSTLREDVRNACEEIDSCIFTGTLIYSDEEREELKRYISRWRKVITQHEAIMKLEEMIQSED